MRVRCPDIPIDVYGTFKTVWPLLELINVSEITWRLEKLDRDRNVWKYSGTKPKA